MNMRISPATIASAATLPHQISTSQPRRCQSGLFF
jgi:hypothetical protein